MFLPQYPIGRSLCGANQWLGHENRILIMRIYILIVAVVVGAVFAFALVCARSFSPTTSLAINVLGHTNLPSGQPVTLLQLSNACSSEIQFTGDILEVTPKGAATSSLGRISPTRTRPLKPHGTLTLKMFSQGKGSECKLTVQYSTLDIRKQVREKCAGFGFSPRLLRKSFTSATVCEWVSE